jgi:hypothetical protein
MRELHAEEENSAGQLSWIRSRIVPASGLLIYVKRPAAALTYERACLMDSNSIPTALLMAVGTALLLAMLPTLLGRKVPGDSEVFESLLARVNHLRQGQFPMRYRRLSSVEARAKLLAQAREGLDQKSFFKTRFPT